MKHLGLREHYIRSQYPQHRISQICILVTSNTHGLFMEEVQHEFRTFSLVGVGAGWDSIQYRHSLPVRSPELNPGRWIPGSVSEELTEQNRTQVRKKILFYFLQKKRNNPKAQKVMAKNREQLRGGKSRTKTRQTKTRQTKNRGVSYAAKA